MSGIILCRSKEAENPYYIQESGINIYTLEELCYYIYNNIYIIGNDFICTELIEFIRSETKENRLADRLFKMKTANSPLAEMLVTILKYVDYYGLEQIEQLLEALNVLSTQNVQERLKMRADTFLRNKKYYSAIKDYLDIIERPRDYSLSGIFYAEVYHNTGVALARMFLYNQAVPFFETAYKLGQHEESVKYVQLAKLLASGYENITSDELSPDEEAVKHELETVLDNARYSDEYRRLQNMEKIKENGQVSVYYQEISDVMDDWLKKYMWNVL